MAQDAIGPGELTTSDVGVFSIARTQLIDTRFAMAYAAGINDVNPAYFDDEKAGGVTVHPGIVFSLQWAARFRPDQPVNMRAAPFGVHATTDLIVHRPFRVGDAITTQGCFIAKRQIQPGVYTADRYRMTDSHGELVAELYYNGITRFATLDGPDVAIDEEPAWPSVGTVTDRPIWRAELPIGRHAGQQYTECAQIYNPIHTEPSVAKAAGLPDMILHGSATKALSLSAVIDRCFSGDADRVTRLCGQLRGMVLMNSSITVEGLAEEIVEGEKRVAFRTLNSAGEPAVSNGIVCGRA